MKLKRYFFVLIILCLFSFPKDIYAEDVAKVEIVCPTSNISVSVCDSDECDFYDLEEAFYELRDYYNDCPLDNLTINIGEGYYYVDYFSLGNINTLKIKGQNKENTIIRVYEFFSAYNVNNVYISNLTIKGNNTDGFFGVGRSRNVYLDNLLVDAKNSKVGIESYHNDNVEVNEVEVRGAQAFGIYNDQCSLAKAGEYSSEPTASLMAPYRNILNIIDSDISNNACGILDGCLPDLYPEENANESFESIAGESMLTYEYDTTVVDNSKIACAVAYGRYYNYSPPSIYIKSNNTWIQKPVYDDNVFEEYDGRVIIDLEEDRTVSISKKDNLVIESIFDEVSDVEWEVENEEIAKVENGKIVPLKVGRTFLTATDGRTNYRINLVVTNDLLKNPNTLSIGYVLIIVLVFGTIGSFVYKKQKLN